jgi:hypothetical protein
MGSAALALVLMCEGAVAAASCARPQDVAALRTAALQQHLMVASLACNQVAAYNRFVISNRGSLVSYDHALMEFFVRLDGQSGAEAYHSFKTGLANDASLLSLHDPQFCAAAVAAFSLATDFGKPLADLAAALQPSATDGYSVCPSDNTASMTVAAAPNIATPVAVAPAAPQPGYDRGEGEDESEGGETAPGQN